MQDLSFQIDFLHPPPFPKPLSIIERGSTERVSTNPTPLPASQLIELSQALIVQMQAWIWIRD